MFTMLTLYVTSEELIVWRKKHGLTQIELAKMLGVTKPCISMWESGKRHIPSFLHLALKCLKVKKGGEYKLKGKKTQKRKEGRKHGSKDKRDS